MKNSVCLFVTVFFTLFFVCLKEVPAETGKDEKQSIKMLFFNVPPHVFIDNNTGKVTGAVYEFINDHLSHEMGVDFKWDTKTSNIPRQLHTLESKPGYAAALLVYSHDRSQRVDYTKIPYVMNQSAIIVRQSSSLTRINSIEDILPLKIGYAMKTFLTPFMRDERIKFDLISAPDFLEVNIKKLFANRVDAVYAPDKAGLLFILNKTNKINNCKALDLPEGSVPSHVVFSKGSKEMVEKYNQAFSKLDGQALYSEILKKYIGPSK